MKMFRIMARLELINIFGINEIRHSKNPREKRRKLFLIITMVILGAVLLGYSGGAAYLLTTFDLSDKIPMLFFMISFLLQFALGVFSARSRIYREKDLDMIAALPVRWIPLVAARVFRMYVEGVVVTLGFLIPSMLVYGIRTGAGALLYVGILPAGLILAVLPTVLAAWVGLLFAAVIAKSRLKVLSEVVVSVVLVIVMLLAMSILSPKGTPAVSREGQDPAPASQSVGEAGNTQDASEEKNFADLSKEEQKAMMAESVKNTLEQIEKAFPIVKSMGDLLAGPDVAGLLIYAAVSLVLMALTVFVIGRLFFRISAGMVSVAKHREYHLESLRTRSVMKALVKKEAARYFSTGVYVANTIIGPVLATAMAVATIFLKPEDVAAKLGKNMPVQMDFYALLPYLTGMFFVMVSISSSSLSMEGRNWWIPRSLPLSAREILGAKVLFNLMVLAPFYAVSELILLFSVKADLMERLWLIIIPGIAIVFSALLGMVLNLRFPKFRWDNATEVVKQSAASGLSILGGFVLILPGVGAMFLPKLYRNLVSLGFVLLLAVICWRMYRKICRVNLAQIG